MEATARELLELVYFQTPFLQQIPDSDASAKPSLLKWSKKEILGHLIDSACNNQQKFVRTLLAAGHVVFDGYDQDEWVHVQQYQQRDWLDIIDLWALSNRHLAHIMRHSDPTKLENTISVSGAGPYSLRFVMTDYVEHLKHHLIQILPNSGLKSSFSMSPYV